MQAYELTYIIAGDTIESEVKSVQKNILDIITNNQGKITKEEFLGKKQLAYPIKKQNFGFYVLINFNFDPLKINDIEHEIKLVEKVIRHLIIKQKIISVKKLDKEASKKTTKKNIKSTEEKEGKVKVQKAESKIKKEKPKLKESEVKKSEKAEQKTKEIIEKEKKKIIEEKEREEVLDKKLEEILKEDSLE